MGKACHRITDIKLDEKSVVRRTADVEHERAVAIYDLLEDNHFAPTSGVDGPFRLTLRLEEDRLIFDIGDEADALLESIAMSVKPFRRVIKDYFDVCESYFEAIKTATPSRIEAIDMGRRGLHNEGSEVLRERLGDRVEIDFNTARRLFTLLCVLHIKG
ncbi:UPF0262 family protein [Limibacillus sp. MBR-115]|jgi:uncharacterized protein (UPF0262 family)|uniref:UPF0262 family protein n=1 Tax=Limibacillus sp. MBR-115 TaxID=3156465 RepID=UPI0033909972